MGILRSEETENDLKALIQKIICENILKMMKKIKH